VYKACRTTCYSHTCAVHNGCICAHLHVSYLQPSKARNLKPSLICTTLVKQVAKNQMGLLHVWCLCFIRLQLWSRCLRWSQWDQLTAVLLPSQSPQQSLHRSKTPRLWCMSASSWVLRWSASVAFPSISPHVFLSESLQHSGIGGAAAGKKNRTWKNLKQILALERTLPWKLTDPSCEFSLLLLLLLIHFNSEIGYISIF